MLGRATSRKAASGERPSKRTSRSRRDHSDGRGSDEGERRGRDVWAAFVRRPHFTDYALGMQLYDDGSGAVRVENILPWGPAAFSGRIALHDEILSVAEVPCWGMSASQVVNLLQGPSGSPLRVVVRAGELQYDVFMLRGIAHAPSRHDFDLQHGSVGAIIVECTDCAWQVEHVKRGGGAWLGSSPGETSGPRSRVEPSLMAGDLIETVNGTSVKHVPDAPTVLCGLLYTRVQLGILRSMSPLSVHIVRGPVLCGELLHEAEAYRHAVWQVRGKGEVTSSSPLNFFRPSSPSGEHDSRGIQSPHQRTDPHHPMTTASSNIGVATVTLSPELGKHQEGWNQERTRDPNHHQLTDDDTVIWLKAPNVASVQAATSNIHADLDKMLANLTKRKDDRPTSDARVPVELDSSDQQCEQQDQAGRSALYKARAILGTTAAHSTWSSRGSLGDDQISQGGILDSVHAVLGGSSANAGYADDGITPRPLLTSPRRALEGGDDNVPRAPHGPISVQTGASQLYALPQAPRLLYLLREGCSDHTVLRDSQMAAANITLEDVRLARKVFQVDPASEATRLPITIGGALDDLDPQILQGDSSPDTVQRQEGDHEQKSRQSGLEAEIKLEMLHDCIHPDVRLAEEDSARIRQMQAGPMSVSLHAAQCPDQTAIQKTFDVVAQHHLRSYYTGLPSHFSIPSDTSAQTAIQQEPRLSPKEAGEEVHADESHASVSWTNDLTNFFSNPLSAWMGARSVGNGDVRRETECQSTAGALPSPLPLAAISTSQFPSSSAGHESNVLSHGTASLAGNFDTSRLAASRPHSTGGNWSAAPAPEQVEALIQHQELFSL